MGKKNCIFSATAITLLFKLLPPPVKMHIQHILKFHLVNLVFLAGSMIVGCRTIGPSTIPRDRFDYTAAISTSWKRQMLLNLVKIRYDDAPVFLEVSSIINQYQFDTRLDAHVVWDGFLPGDSYDIGGSGRYSDRPTITYSPLTGEEFTRNLLTPIPPSAVLSIVETGRPIDHVFRICVQSINHIDNGSRVQYLYRKADPDFYPLLLRLKHLQKSGALGLRIEKEKGQEKVILFFERNTDQNLTEDIIAVKQLLDLALDADEFNLVYGALPRSRTEIAILSRSMMEILGEIAACVDVPQKDIDQGRVTPTFAQSDEEQTNFPALIRVYSGLQSPDDAFVTIRYRDNYFWIDDRDPRSKRMLSFLMILFNLAKTEAPTGAPIVTIPTN